MLEQGDVGQRVVLGDADGLAEAADGGRGVAAATHAGDGGHAGVVPAGHALLLDELEQAALGHHRVGEVEAGELDLLGLGGGVEGAQEPVVEGAVHLELEGADGVRDALVGVLERVRVVVHRVDAPGVAGVVVGRLADAVDDRIAQVHVGRRHVDLGAQHRLALVELAAGHLGERRKVGGDGGIAGRARLAGGLLVAVVGADFLLGQEAHVGLAQLDQPDGVGVHPREVVGRLVVVLAPVEAEPADVLLDRVDVFHLFLGGVGVVHAQVAAALEFQGEAEVEADRLGVADVEVAVGLRGEARGNRGVLAGGEVGVDDLLDEVAVRFRGHGGRGGRGRPSPRNRRKGLGRERGMWGGGGRALK